jgi:hypothetical protein
MFRLFKIITLNTREGTNIEVTDCNIYPYFTCIQREDGFLKSRNMSLIIIQLVIN